MSATFDGVELEMHSHLCVFHRGRAERDALLIPFLRDGLHLGQACRLWMGGVLVDNPYHQIPVG